jgi:hypothetical protein
MYKPRLRKQTFMRISMSEVSHLKSHIGVNDYAQSLRLTVKIFIHARARAHTYTHTQHVCVYVHVYTNSLVVKHTAEPCYDIFHVTPGILRQIRVSRIS